MTASDLTGALTALRHKVHALLEPSPRCHDWDHTERVCFNARRIARAEGADLAVVEFAALLHDIGRAEEFRSRGKSCHACQGAERAPALLLSVGIENDEFVGRVADAVRSHRYRRRDNDAPASLEAKVVYDADKLDSMGAIGIGRAFHFAGHVGARVHNTEAEALGSEAYSAEDSAYREYLVKLRHLHNAMLTAEGRRIAEERHHFMVAFFDRLNRETCGLPRAVEHGVDSHGAAMQKIGICLVAREKEDRRKP